MLPACPSHPRLAARQAAPPTLLFPPSHPAARSSRAYAAPAPAADTGRGGGRGGLRDIIAPLKGNETNKRGRYMNVGGELLGVAVWRPGALAGTSLPPPGLKPRPA